MNFQRDSASVSFVVGSTSWDRKWAWSLEWQLYLCLLLICEYCYYLVLSSNISVEGDEMKRENTPIRLSSKTWCSLFVPQCATSDKGNWNFCFLYWQLAARWRPLPWLQIPGCTPRISNVTRELFWCVLYFMGILITILFSYPRQHSREEFSWLMQPKQFTGNYWAYKWRTCLL